MNLGVEDLVPRKTRRHVPLRTCIVCHQKRAKQDLIRVVHTPEGAIEIDLTGKRSGRGAYFCRDEMCQQLALDPALLQRVLKCRVSAEDVAALRMQIEPLLGQPLAIKGNPRCSSD
jgi:predicted RNA-binding protein YlxR (DUF448 family)